MRKWFGNLKVSQKLMLISIFFVMPDSVMLYLFITGINENIQFARMEKKGNEYQRPLEELLELFPEHGRLAEHLLRKENPAPADVARKQAQIDEAFDTLERVDERIGAELQFTDEGLAKRKREHYRVRIVRGEWVELKSNLLKLKPEASVERHLHLVSDIRTMITHAGDLSNLILDPDLDSYYLMDATLLALPQAQDRISLVMAHGEAALKDAKLDTQERQFFAIYATLLREADVDRVVSSIQTALNEDPNFYGTSITLQARVPPALKEFSDASQLLINVTAKLAETDTPDVTAEQYIALGQKARDASFKLWRIADEEVDTLLQKRVDAYIIRRARSLIVAACALLAAIGFVTFITRSISKPLQQQTAELTLANTSLQAEIADRKRAEETAALFRSLVEHSKDPIYLIDSSKDWRLSYINEAGQNLFNLPHERLAQMSVSDWDPDFTARNTPEFWNKLKQGEPCLYETVHKLADGRTIPVETSFSYLKHAGAEYLVGWFRDITERKLAAEKVADLNKQLLIAARQSGMAEVASSVLHNAGNVLNSVNVSATLITEQIKRSQLAGLRDLSALINAQSAHLSEFIETDPRGKQLPAFLAMLADYWESEQQSALTELDNLNRNIQHVKDIIATQQSLTGTSGFEEPVKLAHVIENALKIASASLEHNSISIKREYEDLPSTLVDKSKLLQILINLLQNAKDAIAARPPGLKTITIKTVRKQNVFRVLIKDNGVGIQPGDLTRIFSFGFTTKATGHGIGLHYSALSAKGMGGSLTAFSAGSGEGATFALEIPYKEIEAPR
jgi:PAS domain S-box-containing protein